MNQEVIEHGEVKVHMVHGPLPEDLFEALFRVKPQESARTFQRLVELELRQLGFAVRRDVRVADRGDGRAGKVSLVASRGDREIALELDRGAPRRKSFTKLGCFGPDTSTALVVYRPPGEQRASA